MIENLITCGVMFVEGDWSEVQADLVTGQLTYEAGDGERYLVGELGIDNPAEVADIDSLQSSISSGNFGNVNGMIMGFDKCYAILSDNLAETRDSACPVKSTGDTIKIDLNILAEDE